MRRDQRPHGFTIVETMVAGSLMVSVSLLSLMWFQRTTDLYWTATTQRQMRADAHQATRRLIDELRNATRTSTVGSPPNATIAANRASITWYLPADGPDANTLIIDALGNIEWNLTQPQGNSCQNNPTCIVYSVNAARQLIRTQNNQPRVLANNIQSLRFEDVTSDGTLATNEVWVRLTLQMTGPSRRAVQATSNDVIRLRN